MMKRLCALLLTVTLCGGCLGGVELRDRAMITGIGMDSLQDGCLVTFELYGGEKGEETTLTTVYGETISEAMTKGSVALGKQLFLGSVQILILGEDFAREKAGDVSAYLFNQYKISPKLPVAVSKTAGDALAAVSGGVGQITQALTDGEQAGQAQKVTLNALREALESDNSAVALPYLTPSGETPPAAYEGLTEEQFLQELLKNDTEQASSDSSEQQDAASADETASESPSSAPERETAPQLITGGLLLSKSDQTLLSLQQIQGLCWLGDDAKAITVSTEDGSGNRISAVSGKISRRSSLAQTGDAYVFTFDINVKLYLAERPFTADKDALKTYPDLFAQSIKTQIQAGLDGSLRQGRDVLQLHSRYGRDANNTDWNSFLQNAGYAVNVDVTMEAVG